MNLTLLATNLKKVYRKDLEVHGTHINWIDNGLIFATFILFNTNNCTLVKD